MHPVTASYLQAVPTASLWIVHVHHCGVSLFAFWYFDHEYTVCPFLQAETIPKRHGGCARLQIG